MKLNRDRDLILPIRISSRYMGLVNIDPFLSLYRQENLDNFRLPLSLMHQENLVLNLDQKSKLQKNRKNLKYG